MFLNNSFLQFAAGRCSPTIVPCNLQQAYVPQQLSPATCSKVSNHFESSLQFAATFQTVLKVPCNLRQGFKPVGKSPATCGKVSNHFESLLQYCG
jgi:hypothetical protein